MCTETKTKTKNTLVHEGDEYDIPVRVVKIDLSRIESVLVEVRGAHHPRLWQWVCVDALNYSTKIGPKFKVGDKVALRDVSVKVVGTVELVSLNQYCVKWPSGYLDVFHEKDLEPCT